MKLIQDWLEDAVEDLNGALDLTHESAIDQQAELLRAGAEKEGYTVDQLTEACGGDIADYIRSRRAGSGAVDEKMAGDNFPIPVIAAKQEGS